MSFRQFTWWRRFHSTFKLRNDQVFKGYSKLLQRIEFGEFEYCNLSEEVLLEEEIYRLEIEEVKKNLSRSSDSTIEAAIADRRVLKNKRVQLMMKNHCKKEQEILHKLVLLLSEEFKTAPEDVYDFIESFDGTTRHLYFALRAISKDKNIPSAEEVYNTRRTQQNQPRHIMRKKESKHWNTWVKVVRNNKVWGAYGISY